MKYLFILLLGLGFSQTEVSQKVIEITVSQGESMSLDILYPEYDLEWAIINVIGTSLSISECYLKYDNIWSGYSKSGLSYEDDGETYYYHSTYDLESDFFTNNQQDFSIYCGDGTMKLLVTAEFPQEDTGYIEEGFEFCLQPGANLLSFPCDNPISVSASLPQGSENFITQIIGEGVATEYNPALGWIGSLAEFTPGSGYWFKSNESLCFEYECVEN